MLNLCIRFAIVPTCFTTGLLVPILKKPSLDPRVPKNYRPITISCTFSKIIELYILDSCQHHEFSDLQFGFVEGRGTNMVTALTNDIISYCVKRWSPVYACSLDAAGAFDFIPHSILFKKSMDVLPDHCWLMLINWYRSLSVQVRVGQDLSKPINVRRGTRQGGLTSPFIFNLCYQDMIDNISNLKKGIKIGDSSFNVFAYADDV